MNLDYEKKIETEIHRELNALPTLSAPATLISRVMAAIEKRAALPWFRRAWTSWPLALRFASLATLLACFGGLTFGVWEFFHAGPAVVSPKLSGGLSALAALCNVLLVLLTSISRVINQLGPIFLLAYIAALTFGYAICLGLGTLGMKVALGRR